jgi:hypothetical protein
VDRAAIDDVLAKVEAILETGAEADLAGSGFWKAVTAVKRNPALVEEYAARIASIDRAAFERWALIKMPVAIGTALASLATAVGLGLIAWAYRLTGTAQGVVLLAGIGVVLTATHGLGHLAVGTSLGIRFTHWFVAGVRRPQPGVKVDYRSYLQAPARNRAWMHAAGALVSKTVPFMGLGAGWAMRTPGWTMAVLGGFSLLQIVTDIVWSTKASDWKKFRREMGLARAA